MSITEDLGIPRPERGNLHGSQKPSSMRYEFYSYRMVMVVHNGKEETEKTSVLKLSDLYYNEDEEPSLELCVIQHNINGIDQNSEFSRQLYEYEWLVEKIRESAQNVNIAAAVNLAIEEMPEDFTIRDWVLENKSEVIEMSIFEYNEQEHLAHVREEGIAEGTETERNRGILNLYESLIETGVAENAALTKTAEKYYSTPEEINKIISVRRQNI